MSFFGCNCKCRCATAAAVVSAVVGVVAAFLQITGTVTVTAAFLWVLFGIAVGYLAVLLVASSLSCAEQRGCGCTALNEILAGILGTILFAIVLLAVGVVATSVVSAILVGLLVFFFALTVTGTACYIRSLSECTL
jgi:hypothetical protein